MASTFVAASASLAIAAEPGVVARPVAAPALPDAAWVTPAAHPRLFSRAATFDALKHCLATDPTTAALAAIVVRQADDARAEPAITYDVKSGGILIAVRAAQGRILSSAMAFWLTGDRRYFERARQELLALAALPDWNPAHFLDVGEAALASGVGLDWLYDTLAPADRDTIARAIVDKALLPSLAQHESPNSWVGGDFNWNPVCHAGLTAGAIAVMEREPDLARRIVERALANVPFAAATYAPDGAYPEGPSYWSYGTNFYVLFLESLRSAFGTSCGFETRPGFLASVDWLAQMVGPTGQDFNFADYHTRHGVEPVAFWFARELRRRDVARGDLAGVDQLARQIAASGPGFAADHSGPSRLMTMALLYWDPSLPVDAAVTPLPRVWVAGGHQPVAVLRSAWNDPKATYVAIKGGTPNGSHGHMDVGSFVLEADGVRWAVDLGTENYDRMRSAKIDLWNYTQASSRWSVFRCGPDAHNLLRFDNGPQTFDGFATIAPLAGNRPDAASGGAVVDLTPMYRGPVSAVARRVELNADRSATITDTWTAGPRAVATSFQWLTQAAVTVTPAGVTLRQAGQTLSLNVDGPADRVVSVEDVSQPRGPQDSPNPGLSRILVQCHTPALDSARLIVRAVPGTVGGL